MASWATPRAEVLPAGAAIAAHAAQPRDPDPVIKGEALCAGRELVHHADDLVPPLRVRAPRREIPFGEVEVLRRT